MKIARLRTDLFRCKPRKHANHTVPFLLRHILPPLLQTFNVNTPTIIQQTRTWLKTVVINHAICPFAKREYERNSIRYCVAEATSVEECLSILLEECRYLCTNPDCETTLLILAHGFNDFDTFLTLIDFAEALLYQQGYEGVYQLASLHPDYRFANVPRDDPANYTNRSPYPTLHLLREASIESVLKNHPDPASIPDRNIAYTRQLGIAAVQKLLADCF